MRYARAPRTGFNPLPSPKQGETAAGALVPHTVSSFQSAPLTEARGDMRSLIYRRGRPCFNPLPSPKQGETRSSFIFSSPLNG